ncbi:MAG: CinA family protein [Gammaproteobacteria bacterium]|nr:CinA family protein [Gammaproteobacteria bacterium]
MVYLREIETLSQQLGEALIKRNWTITTAESCTGGGISAAITETAGSSAYFERAFVTYSNQAKAEMLAIPITLINNNGAVSQQTVEAMAKGAALKANANLAIAVSGIAGPGGGSDAKPVGTVWVSIFIQYVLDEKTTTQLFSHCFLFSGNRHSIQQQTIKYSLNKALELTNKII